MDKQKEEDAVNHNRKQVEGQFGGKDSAVVYTPVEILPLINICKSLKGRWKLVFGVWKRGEVLM